MAIKELYKKKHDLIGELFRFAVVGGICSVVTLITQVACIRIFFEGSVDYMPNAISSGVGFGLGIIVNYILSLLFVFSKKHQRENGKNVMGSIKFVALALVGLVIYSLTNTLFISALNFNTILAWILATSITLVFNYLSRKLIIFK